METIWTFNTKNFYVTLACEPEQNPDLSWDETGETRANLESGLWDCVMFRVAVFSQAGDMLGADYLGESIYADVRDFRKEHIGARGAHGSYFRDMVSEAIKQARTHLHTLQTIKVRG